MYICSNLSLSNPEDVNQKNTQKHFGRARECGNVESAGLGVCVYIYLVGV